MQRFAVAGVVAVAMLTTLGGVAGASTFTVGSAAEPAAFGPSNPPIPLKCTTAAVFGQVVSGAGQLSAMPSGGQLTQWQTNTSLAAAAAAGENVTLLALAPVSGGGYRIDAADSETLPNPLPAGGIVTYTPATPMEVSDGDVLALAGGSDAVCGWSGATTLSDGVDLFATVTTAPGTLLSPVSAPTAGAAVPAAATVVATQDSAVTTATLPAGPAGSTQVLVSTVSNKGPASNPLTLTDAVPAGLKVAAAVSTAGPCATVGQVVTCTVSGLAPGQSAPVYVIATAAAGSYTNSVTLVQPAAATDPVTANNSAAAKFTVAKAVIPKCTVANLANVSLGSAKKLLTALNCKVGKVTKSASSKMTKGNVIKTTPGHGSFAAGKAIAIVESSGPPAKKHNKTRKHKK